MDNTKGQRIRCLREEKGFSLTEFAEMIGTSKQNLYKYENSIITNIPSDKIEAIAEVCHVTPQYIMGWTNDKQDIQMQIPKTIGEKIKFYRTKLDLTQEDLAIAANTKKQTIHKYETGIITSIPASKIKAIADKLGTTPDFLMGWDDNSKSYPVTDGDQTLPSILNKYNKLNDTGKAKAETYIDDLLAVPSYTTEFESIKSQRDGVKVAAGIPVSVPPKVKKKIRHT